MLQHFIIEGKYLGQSPRGFIRFEFNQWQRPLSKIFFCATCGEVFAKCPITHPDTSVSPFEAVYACCRRCKPQGDLLVPGSITHHEPEFLAAFPDAVLLWEVLRHLDLYPG